METGFLHFHSYLRYLVLTLLVISLVTAYNGILTKKEYTKRIQKLHFFSRMLLMIEGIIGIFLYFIKGYGNQFNNISNLPSSSLFFLIQHLITMLLAIIICGIGFPLAMKEKTDMGKFKKIAGFYTTALILILTAIPWVFIYSWAK